MGGPVGLFLFLRRHDRGEQREAAERAWGTSSSFGSVSDISVPSLAFSHSEAHEYWKD